MIFVGTSGFSFEDWRGEVYPENLPKSQMLKYYWGVLGFNAVEINSTYYSIPSYRTIVSLLRKTPSDFVFTVKLPGHITHEGWRDGIDEDVVKRYLDSIAPMEGEGRFKMHLAQFPNSFRYSPKNMDYIERISEIFHPLAVEFRHDSWNRERVYEILKEHDLTYVVVDEPRLDRLFPYVPRLTSDTAYFRFHGRNERWFEAQGGERYDYLYSREELDELVKDVKKLSEKSSETFVFFNNCHNGKAVKNALMFKEMIS